ncbi:NACHT domain-containing NTPase [Nostoc linckia FACHB-104]|nr:NACHT domain-containing NTPase [Nostoc linckia FACHB-104]
MVKRSLQASHQGIQSAKLALIDKFGTQQKLADALSVTRQPVNKFFNRKPVDSSLFVEICKKLGLEWQEIQENRQSEVKQTSEQDSDIDALVQEIREQVKPSIKEKCGTMRVLDMPQPIELTGERGIYTNVNILEKITGRRRLDISELLQNSEPDDFERFGLNRVKEKQVPGIEAVQQHQKLMVLGKPGAGKTTFLKYLAMQCIEGQYLTNQVPLFITLKDFAETPKQPDMLEYIAQQLAFCGVQDASAKADKLLRQGKVLVLLDGLDEVREEDTKRVLRQIRDISDKFHTNQFVITCRIAAKEYTFERFTEVEVADFDEEQIAIFAQNWFQLSDSVNAEKFIQKLEENKPIQEMASSPLLLTLLCLVFGESADFPNNRSELYKEGLDILLKKWDAKRNIKRDQVYQNLSLQRKEDLLSQIALITFEQKNYFFKQKTVELYIANFIQGLDKTSNELNLEQDSQVILKSIAAQHGLLMETATGVYCFSSRTLQAYFAAREIVNKSGFEKLLRYINDKDWREIFLLSVGMMRNADEFLLKMQQKIRLMSPDDNHIKNFLSWVSQKSSTISSFEPFAVWTFYLTLDCDLFSIIVVSQGHTNSLYQAIYHGCNLATNSDLISAFHTSLSVNQYRIFSSILSESNELALDRYLALTLNLACNLERTFNIGFVLSQRENNINASFNTNFIITNLNKELFQTLEYAINYAKDRNFKNSIYHLRIQIYKILEDKNINYLRLQTNIQNWIKNLRELMIKYRNIGHNWQFNDVQTKLLQSYYNANKLLVDCLNSDCYLSREVRQKIEETLLLPITNE